MANIKYFYFIIFVISLNTFSQTGATEETSELSLNSGTISNQFEYIIQRSNNYQDFKVVKKTWLSTLKAHTLDSLSAVHKLLTDTEAIVNNQNNEITDLKLKLSNTEQTLANTNQEKDSMSLFGLQLSKTNYNILMWCLIGILLVLLLFFIYKFKSSNTITQEAKKALTATEEEFEEHRRVALEREQKVRRQLQDEINKHKK
ncbi:MAG: tRNA (guanine-N1)-methyltransferase [Flavobacteriaceae bacterium]